jgi:hypothetical protein
METWADPATCAESMMISFIAVGKYSGLLCGGIITRITSRVKVARIWDSFRISVDSVCLR